MLRLDNVIFNRGGKRILENINIHIKKSEVVSILGPSGIGKTTLAKIMSGLLNPISGSVFLEGNILKTPVPTLVLSHQESDLFDWLTVEENVGLVGGKKNAEKWLNIFGLVEYRNNYPKTLSGGMKKKVSLARAASVNPSVIILDEPFSSLDEKQKIKYYKEFKNLANQEGVAIIVVTHDINEAYNFSNRIIFLGGNPATIIDEKIPTGEESSSEKRDLVLKNLESIGK